MILSFYSVKDTKKFKIQQISAGLIQGNS